MYLQTGMRCMDCGYNCHEKCIDSVPKNCTKFKSVRESGVSIQTSTKPTSLDTTSVGSGEAHFSAYLLVCRCSKCLLLVKYIQMDLDFIFHSPLFLQVSPPCRQHHTNIMSSSLPMWLKTALMKVLCGNVAHYSRTGSSGGLSWTV